MKTLKTLNTLVLSALLVWTANATNITIYDGNGQSGGTYWYRGATAADPIAEVSETEPGTETSYPWDLQSFDLTGNILTLSGGYDLKYGYNNYMPGDLFFDINGGGWDYVATIGNGSGGYGVYKLVGGDTLPTTQIASSSPWRYNGEGMGHFSGLLFGGGMTYNDWSDAYDTLHTLTLDISWLDNLTKAGDIVTIHNTMECGNDKILGRFTTVPDGGSSLVFMGLSTIGLISLRRKLS